ncbi:HET-domain-containing protein [Ganoderma leucocontextum]|nr:HET-domain-containing protein [Ganoderma leucocontextum]
MWLLSTDRAELHYFSSPEAVPGGYAILSHVWDSEEQTFQDLKRLREDCAKSGANPRDHTSPKIKQSCTLAERHGYKWIWNDTCCIDKTSSAELSEAINSMFHYYSRAEVCYAYLRDVPNDEDPRDADSAFRKSRWYTRGWTLQELIAPALLIFLSADWQMLGTKGDLAPLVEEVTRVPASVLRLETPLDDVSVAKRMSWAAARQTTRLEDEAYCLMGIFGVNMPTLYGEGRRAFRRLQEEIMKQTTDTSLFVWGASTTTQALQSAVGYCDIEHAHADAHSFLFAPAPSAFKDISDISYEPPRTVEFQMPANGGKPIAVTTLVKLPTFTIAPYAVHAHVPVFEISGLFVAVIFCTKASTQEAIGLVLTPCHTRSDPSRPLFHTGGRLAIQSNERSSRFRICMVNLAFHAPTFTASKSSWKDVYITHLPPPPATDAAPVVLKSMISSLSASFRFPRWEIERLQEHGFYLDSELTKTDGWQDSDPTDSTIALVFRRHVMSAGGDPYLEILLGRCESTGMTHWASVQFHTELPEATRSFVHSCPADHASEWLHGTRTFETHQRRAEAEDVDRRDAVSLSLTPCPMNPTRTRVIKVAFVGAREVQ